MTTTGRRDLVLVGGAALNLEANTVATSIADRVFVPPFCDDTGQALGAAAYVSTRERRSRPRFRSPYLGPGGDVRFTDSDIERAVDALTAGHLLLVHNGRSEVGPRALGHRSFLFRADDEALKRHVSEEIKGRAWFRPIAPVVKQEEADALCVGPVESPYMLFSIERDGRLERLWVMASTVMGQRGCRRWARTTTPSCGNSSPATRNGRVRPSSSTPR